MSQGQAAGCRRLQAIRSTVRETTWESYALPLRVYVIPRIRKMQLRDLRPMHLNDLYGELLKDGRVDGRGGLARSTVGRIHAVLHRALGDAMRWAG